MDDVSSMIAIREAIVVEGKYDKMRLASAVDTIIVETGGFTVFKDREKLALLRLLAQQRGLLILTDSDSAGFVIRNYLSGAIPPAQIKHAYCPEILGKERRKAKPSKEGVLGVEGIQAEILVEALRKAGATFLDQPQAAGTGFRLTKEQLYADGLIGRPDSARRRKQLLQRLGLPQYLSTNRLMEVLSATQTADSYRTLIQELTEESP